MTIDFKKARATADGMLAQARASASAKASAPAVLTSRPSADPGGVAHLNQNLPRKQYEGFSDWVYAGVHRIASRVAGQAVCVAKERSTGPNPTKATEDKWEPLNGHPLIDAVNSPGEPHGSGWHLKYSTAASILLTGAARWHVADGIICIPISWFEEKTATHWHVRRPGASKVSRLPIDEMVAFHLPDPADPFAVASPLQRLSRAAVADDNILASQTASFERSIRPGLALHVGEMASMPGTPGTGRRPQLTPEQRRQLVDAVKNYFQGVQSHGEPFVVDGLVEKISPIFMSPGEIDWLQSGQAVKERILLGLGVSEIILGSPEANKASAAAARGIFVDFCVNPLQRCLSETMTAKLGPMFGDGLRVYLEPATARDDEFRIGSYNSGAKHGCVSINEFRRAVLNLPDIDGGDELIKPSAGPELSGEGDKSYSLNPYTLQPW